MGRNRNGRGTRGGIQCRKYRCRRRPARPQNGGPRQARATPGHSAPEGDPSFLILKNLRCKHAPLGAQKEQKIELPSCVGGPDVDHCGADRAMSERLLHKGETLSPRRLPCLIKPIGPNNTVSATAVPTF